MYICYIDESDSGTGPNATSYGRLRAAVVVSKLLNVGPRTGACATTTNVLTAFLGFGCSMGA